jgi:hypothetical protein
MATANSQLSTTADGFRLQIDREVKLVGSAISMVASGASTATTVAGIRYGELAMGLLSVEAREAGVIIEPLWRSGGGGCDVRVSTAISTLSPPARSAP